MGYGIPPFILLHLATIVPALILGPWVLFRKKGDLTHKVLGRIWVFLMVLGSLLSFGIQMGGGLSWLHGLAVYTIYAVVRGLIAARKHDYRAHRANMIGSYLGLFVAFVFALRPGRLLGYLLWS